MSSSPRTAAGLRAGFAALTLAILALAALPAVASAAFVPGRFVVEGKPLATGAGRNLSVHLSPQGVALEGCLTRSARVRRLRGGVGLTAKLRCGKRNLTLQGSVRGKRVRGVATAGKKRRRFSGRRARPVGLRLKGKRSAPALRTVRKVSLYQEHSPAGVSRLGQRTVARDQLVVFIAPKATVGQVNGMLARIGGGIIVSRSGSRMLAVAIPDPGSTRSLRSLRSSVRRMRGIAHGDFSDMAQPQVVPDGATVATNATHRSRLSHLLASRMAAAFNARGAIRAGEEPTVVVSDRFGGVQLPAALDAAHALCADRVDNDIDGTIDAADASCGSNPNLENAEETAFNAHGYHVSGIIHGDWANNPADPAGLVTGAFPARGRNFVTLDGTGRTSSEENAGIIDALTRLPGRVVLNTSLAEPGIGEAEATRRGTEWARQAAGLTGRVLHATAAGNQGGPTLANSIWSAAALRDDLAHVLSNGTTQPVARLMNTLVVENVTETADSSALACLRSRSNVGGTIAAPGTEVYSYNIDGSGLDSSGTSQASPVIAGLATYIWSIAPELTPQQVIAAIRENHQPPASRCARAAAPALDGYRAVLSLDLPGPPSPTAYPVRRAILDANDDTKFDEADLERFAPRLTMSPEPSTRDWSRYDLNGDGFTGGTRGAQFDLDRSSSMRAGRSVLDVSVPVQVEGRTMTFDETSPLTDEDILCYYAYSALYVGSPGQREDLLSSRCAVSIVVSPSFTSIQPGATEQFRATVQNSDEQDVLWDADRGEITPGGLYTAPQTIGADKVTATWVADSNVRATADVTVESSIPLNRTVIVTRNGEPRCVPDPGSPTQTFSFQIRPGGTVTWQNNYFPEDTPELEMVEIRSTPDSSQQFNLVIPQGGSGSVTFPNAGSYGWECDYSFTPESFGVIQVGFGS